jgi:tRNA U38,U39,U40 pseudouridine synthase TruA
MIRCELLRDHDIVVVTPEGPLEEADFEQLAKVINPLIAAKQKLAGLMICLRSFPGWRSFGAFRAHLRFIADHHRGIERIAVVTDSGLLKIVPRIASAFVHPYIRQFGFGEVDGRWRGFRPDVLRARLDCRRGRR